MKTRNINNRYFTSIQKIPTSKSVFSQLELDEILNNNDLNDNVNNFGINNIQ